MAEQIIAGPPLRRKKGERGGGAHACNPQTPRLLVTQPETETWSR